MDFAADSTLASQSWLSPSCAEILIDLGRNPEAALTFEETLAFFDNRVMGISEIAGGHAYH
jgi:hypothetical protein